MGFLSKLFASTPHQIIVPSLEEQRSVATTSVDRFLDQIYNTFDKESDNPSHISHFRIAGVSYYCDSRDIGFVRSFSFPHTDNPADRADSGLCR